MEIEEIKSKIHNGKYQFRRHALERANLRGINPLDVKHAILSGEIIEEYPDDPRGPSCLIYGKGRKGENLHVVCGLAEEVLWIVTIYIPEEKDWINFRTRRKKE